MIRLKPGRDARDWCLAAAFAASLLSIGCSASRTRFVPPEELPFEALNASRDELLQKLESDSGKVDTIRATVTYVASGDVRGEAGDILERTYDPIRGGLVVSWPSLIRMNGTATLGLVSAFDMTANGEEFRLSVPPQGKFYYGPNDGRIEGEGDNPLLKLRPHHVMQSLFVDIRPYLAEPQVVRSFEETSEGRQRFYVFSFIDASESDGHLLERVWIDRRNLKVGRKQTFGPDGVLDLQVNYDFYQDVGGVQFPQRVAIEKPVEGASLEIDFINIELNAELDQALFQLPFPQGTESIRVGEPTPASIGSGTGILGSPGAGPAAN